MSKYFPELYTILHGSSQPWRLQIQDLISSAVPKAVFVSSPHRQVLLYREFSSIEGCASLNVAFTVTRRINFRQSTINDQPGWRRRAKDLLRFSLRDLRRPFVNLFARTIATSPRNSINRRAGTSRRQSNRFINGGERRLSSDLCPAANPSFLIDTND